MKRSYFRIYIHLVWATKNKEQMILEEIEKVIYTIIEDKCREQGTKIIAIGNTKDHIHLLLSIMPKVAIGDLVKNIKGSTAYYINHKTEKTLYWQDGYGAISISKNAIYSVKQYIEQQKQHHAQNNIQGLLEKYEDSP